MKRIVIVMLLLVAACLPGCSGVIMNAAYSNHLDETAALSNSFANDALAGRMDPNDMKIVLGWNAKAWKAFQDARDGRDPNAK